jgi:hypothetical protein
MKVTHLETKDIEFLSDITIDKEEFESQYLMKHTQYSFWEHKESGNRQFLFTLDENQFNKIFKTK